MAVSSLSATAAAPSVFSPQERLRASKGLSLEYNNGAMQCGKASNCLKQKHQAHRLDNLSLSSSYETRPPHITGGRFASLVCLSALLCTLNERHSCGNPLFLGFVESCEADIGIMTFEDKIEFEDNFHIVLPMKSVKKLVSRSEKLPWDVELKSNSHVELVENKWVDAISATPNSYEFRSSLGSLLIACSLDNACLVEVRDSCLQGDIAT